MAERSSVDAVVIGGGHNGLVAANLLTDAGWEVLVCEATGRAGGAVASTTDLHPGFVTDQFSAFYPLAAASPTFGDLGLGHYGLTWSHAPLVLAHLLADDRCAVLSRDPEVTAASVAGFAAGDGPAWLAMSRHWERMAPELWRALFAPFPPVAAAAGLLRRTGVADALRLARLGVCSVRTLASESFAGDGARALLAGTAAHTDIPPDGAGSGFVGYLLAMAGQSVGFPVPVGGAAALVDALCTRLAAHGGSLRLLAPVRTIVLDGEKATGVRLKSGELIRVRRAVLADVAAPTLYQQLLDPAVLPTRVATDLRRFGWDPPTVKLDWALRAPIGWTARQLADAGTVHLGADLDGLTRGHAQLATGQVPDSPFVILGQMTRSDPTRSPAGTESAWAYTHLPETSLYSAELAADRVEALIERHAPGFASLIVARRVSGPAALAALNPNLIGGAIGGGTAAPHQQLIFRPIPGLGGADTPIRRLYLASASAHPGGGVHGGPGANAARTALRRDALSGMPGRLAIRAAMRTIYR